jgi:carbohydrate-binding DOMON domain-containing protein
MAKIILSLLALALSAHAASSDCSSLIYEVFLPLSNVPLAETYCSSRFPLAPCTSTTTLTSTLTDTTTVATATVTVGRQH